MITKSNQQRLPLFLFGGVTLLGIFFITITKLVGASPLLSMLVPIFLMAAYWFASSRLKRLRLHDEQTGDNLYYMGFLFTLTSLGVSLYQFTSHGSMDDVVRNFGIAITSTIFGIGMRIIYNQTRRDVLDIERTTRHDLASMTRQVRTEMDSMRREFVDFRRINQQMVVEGVNEIMDATKETSEKVRETFEKMVSDSMKPLEDASLKFGESIGQSLGEISEKLSVVVDKIEGTTKKMENVVLPEAVIKNDLAPLVKEMGATLSQYSASMQSSGKSQQDSTKAISELVQQMGKTMVAIEKSIQASGQAIQSNSALNQKVEQNASAQRQMMEKLMRERSQQSVVFTTGGIPSRPVSPPPPPPSFSPSPSVFPPPRPDGAFQPLNASILPSANGPATGSMIPPSVASISATEPFRPASEESKKA